MGQMSNSARATLVTKIMITIIEPVFLSKYRARWSVGAPRTFCHFTLTEILGGLSLTCALQMRKHQGGSRKELFKR